MKFLNKTDYNAELFVSVFRAELKKIMWVLRIAAVSMILFWGFEVYLTTAANSTVTAGDIYYIVLGFAGLIISVITPNLAAKSRCKKLQRRGLDGIHTVRVYDDYMVIHYDNTGAEKNIPLGEITKFEEGPTYIKVVTGRTGTYLSRAGFEMGSVEEFMSYCAAFMGNAGRQTRPGISNSQQTGTGQQTAAKKPLRKVNSIYEKAMLNGGADEEPEEEEEEETQAEETEDGESEKEE